MNAAVSEIITTNILLLGGKYFRAIKPYVVAHIEDGLPLPEKMEKQQAAVHPAINAGFGGSNTGSTGGKIALIYIDDIIMKYGEGCTLSMQSILMQIESAENDNEISSLLFFVDCYGGGVRGLRQLAMAIRNCAKPTVSYISEAACSAAFWLVQQTKYIVSDISAICAIGSCGALYVHHESSKRDEMRGEKYTVFTDDEAIKKALGNNYEELSEEGEKDIRKELNEVKEQFVSDILTSHRGELIRNEEYMRTAVVVKNDEALKEGWIDQIGTFEDAINKCIELSNINTGYEEMNLNVEQTNYVATYFGFPGQSMEDIKASIDALKSENAELKAAMQESVKSSVSSMLSAGIASNKITAKESQNYLSMYEDGHITFDGLKAIMETKEARLGVSEQIEKAESENSGEDRSNWTRTDYMEKDVDALKAMAKNNYEKYINLPD